MGSVFDSDVIALIGVQSNSPGRVAASISSDKDMLQREVSRISCIVRKQCSALATMTVLDVRFKSFPSSVVAAACLYVSRRCLGLPLDDVWVGELVLMTRYTVDDLDLVIRMIDQASGEISQWVESNNQNVPIGEPVTPIKTTELKPSIHPTNSTISASACKNLKYSCDSDEARDALRKVAAEDAMSEKLSPVSITDQYDIKRLEVVKNKNSDGQTNNIYANVVSAT